jgi:hypothetical protein
MEEAPYIFNQLESRKTLAFDRKGGFLSGSDAIFSLAYFLAFVVELDFTPGL